MRKLVISLIGALAVTLPAVTFAQSTLPVPTEPRDDDDRDPASLPHGTRRYR